MKTLLLITMIGFFTPSMNNLEMTSHNQNLDVENIEAVGSVTVCFKTKKGRKCITVKVSGKKKKKKFTDGFGDNLWGEYEETTGRLKISGFPPEINSTQLDILGGQEIFKNLKTKGGMTTVTDGNIWVVVEAE